jgi:hypothetical protein
VSSLSHRVIIFVSGSLFIGDAKQLRIVEEIDDLFSNARGFGGGLSSSLMALARHSNGLALFNGNSLTLRPDFFKSIKTQTVGKIPSKIPTTTTKSKAKTGGIHPVKDEDDDDSEDEDFSPSEDSKKLNDLISLVQGLSMSMMVIQSEISTLKGEIEDLKNPRPTVSITSKAKGKKGTKEVSVDVLPLENVEGETKVGA